MTLATLKAAAHRLIDLEAGAARLRYITDVPGQQGTYLMKIEQARAYAQQFAIVGLLAEVPPYIDAEAVATGQDAIDVANTVIAVEALWNGSVGPAIEGARMAGKKAVSEAATPELVAEALDAAVAVLTGI